MIRSCIAGSDDDCSEILPGSICFVQSYSALIGFDCRNFMTTSAVDEVNLVRVSEGADVHRMTASFKLLKLSAFLFSSWLMSCFRRFFWSLSVFVDLYNHP